MVEMLSPLTTSNFIRKTGGATRELVLGDKMLPPPLPLWPYLPQKYMIYHIVKYFRSLQHALCYANRNVNVIVIVNVNVELKWTGYAANILRKLIFGLSSDRSVYKINQSKCFAVSADEICDTYDDDYSTMGWYICIMGGTNWNDTYRERCNCFNWM